ncbi:MAG TPA: tetratricopeptide repeat protein [Isosphaeraceae bacterium]|jgi:YHS domain-containing protein|nr:tetratricopeptide repeat protein [Isosphaeraceae bacterium]
MRRGVRLAGVLGVVLGLGGGGGVAIAAGDDVPGPLAPFAYLAGAWHGTGIPKVNKLKGWDEKHAWAYKFVKGKPVGMSWQVTKGKVLAGAELTYDEASKAYRLDVKDEAGKVARYTGKLDGRGKTLVLDRDEPLADGTKERISLVLNGNEIRYTVWIDRKEPGAPRFERSIEMLLGKEGESFAAGGAANDGPKCILTGGAATMTVSYEGKSYPVCCTGCRDEFNDNPTKYIALLAKKGGAKATAKPSTSNVTKDDSFLPLDSPEPKKATPAKPTSPKTAEADAPKAKAKEKPKDAAKPKADDKATVRAASLLRQGQALDKAGKAAAALDYYRRIVKDFPDTPAAKTAAGRIKAAGK